VADFLPAEKTRALIDILRTLTVQAVPPELEVRDEEGSLLGRLLPMSSPSANPLVSAEFLEELRQRMESPEPVLSADEFLAYLDSIAPPDR
jgi:hypothetical protein